MKTRWLVISWVLISLGAQAGEIDFVRSGALLDAPDDWGYVEEGAKAFLLNPDQKGKIQVFVTQLKKDSLARAVELYHETTFKGGPSPRKGKEVVVLEKGKVETATGLKGVKGAFGYAKGANDAPEVWTWRYFFERPDGKIVSVCSYVYGDEERAKAQEELILNSFHFKP